MFALKLFGKEDNWWKLAVQAFSGISFESDLKKSDSVFNSTFFLIKSLKKSGIDIYDFNLIFALKIAKKYHNCFTVIYFRMQYASINGSL